MIWLLGLTTSMKIGRELLLTYHGSGLFSDGKGTQLDEPGVHDAGSLVGWSHSVLLSKADLSNLKRTYLFPSSIIFFCVRFEQKGCKVESKNK